MAIPLKKQLQDKSFMGLWRRPATSGLNARYLRNAINTDFRGGVIARRKGTRRVNNTTLSGTGYGVFYARFNSGTNERLVAHGGNISVVTREPTAITKSLPSDWAAMTGNITYFSMLNDYIFMCNRTDNDFKYGGTNLQKWGISAPAAAPTITTPSGDVASTRRYRATYLNSTSGHEGAESAETSSKTLSNQQGQAASPASPTDPQVDQWRLYAAIVTGGRPGVFYRVGTANLGTSISDNLSDATLKTKNILEEFTNNAPSGPLRLQALHQGRIVAVPQDDRSIFYLTDHDGFFSKPESFPTFNFVPVNYRDGDFITAFVSFNEYLLIFKQFSIWAMLGAWPDVKMQAVSYRPDFTSIGTIDQRAVVAFEAEAIFPSHDGIYRIRKGETGDETLFKSRKISGPIDDLYDMVDQSAAMHASYDRSRRQYRLWCSLRTGQEVNRVVVTS